MISDGASLVQGAALHRGRDADGNPVALLGRLVDIEARKQAEALELDRSEGLERF